MQKRLLIFVFAALLIFSGMAFGQANELAVTVGPQIVSGSNYGFGHSAALEANFAHRVINGGAAALYVEIPLTWGFKNPRTFSPDDLRDHYTAFYVTPGLKLKLLPQLPISPYGVLGVGLARFRRTETGQISHENVIDYGIGADWKVLPMISLRAEWRDFNSGVPRLDFPNPGSRQQNNMITFGAAVHF